MKALTLGFLLVLIASAATAQVRPEIAPIIVLNGGSKNPIENLEIQIEPDPTPAPMQAGAPPVDPVDPITGEPILTAAADPNLARTEISSTRKMVEEALKKGGPRFICRGVGPFWILKVGQENIEFDLVGEKFLQFSAPTSTASLNSESVVTNFTSKASNGAEISALLIDSQATGMSCSDGMSDQTYSHSVFINQSGKIYDGCCWMER